MKNGFRILLLTFILFGCENRREEQFYPNGQLKLKVELINNRRSGLLTEYHETGKVKATSNWIEGQLHGEAIEYYENGSIWTISNYVMGETDGKVTFYHEDGRLMEVQIYDDDNLIYFIRYDKDNNVYLESVVPIYDPKNDTIHLEEVYQVTVEVGIDLDGEIRMYTGELDQFDSLVNPIELKKVEDQKFILVDTPRSLGNNSVPIMIDHLPTENDTINASGTIIKHNYFVN